MTERRGETRTRSINATAITPRFPIWTFDYFCVTINNIRDRCRKSLTLIIRSPRMMLSPCHYKGLCCGQNCSSSSTWSCGLLSQICAYDLCRTYSSRISLQVSKPIRSSVEYNIILIPVGLYPFNSLLSDATTEAFRSASCTLTVQSRDLVNLLEAIVPTPSSQPAIDDTPPL